MEYGVQYVMIYGVSVMPLLYVISWELKEVSHQLIFVINYNI